MNRSVETLVPAVRAMFEKMKKLADEKGIGFTLTSTLRTEAEQLALFAQGRKTLKTVNVLRARAALAPIGTEQNRIVTGAPVSVHQFGCAFDVVILDNGRAQWSATADHDGNGKADYMELGALGESVGLKWGGRLRRLRDYCHFEYTGGLSVLELREGKRPEAQAPTVNGHS